MRAGLIDVGLAPALEELVAAAEGGGAEAENGNLEARSAELTIFHGHAPVRGRLEGGAGPEPALIIANAASPHRPSSRCDGHMMTKDERRKG
jgi:hypothetical protein